MSANRPLVEHIKGRFARRPAAWLQAVGQVRESGLWIAEAVAAADEVLAERAAGRAAEPKDRTKRGPTLSEQWADSLARTIGVNLLTLPFGWVTLPGVRTIEPDVVAQDRPLPFGEEAAWLAVGTTDTAAVAAALDLRGTCEATWDAGVEAAYQTLMYVTPPLGEWTLALSAVLSPSPQMPAVVRPLLERLSRQFGDAQYFCNRPGAEAYAWARAAGGRLVRGYTWLAGDVRTEGAPSAEERELGLPPADPPTADAVPQLAAFWSVDPTTLDEHFKEPTLGRLGVFPR